MAVFVLNLTPLSVSPGGKLQLFYLPPYLPDRNPDYELVWKHLKADTVGRMVATGKDDFRAKARSSRQSLQKNPAKTRSFYQKPSLKYAADVYIVTDGLIACYSNR